MSKTIQTWDLLFLCGGTGKSWHWSIPGLREHKDKTEFLLEMLQSLEMPCWWKSALVSQAETREVHTGAQ